MKAKEFLALIKSGTTEFSELDIEGTFINENFSGLHFDRCNLKTCDFSYCSLNDSTFENNYLDATEFKFVHFNNITFKDNSAYDRITSASPMGTIKNFRSSFCEHVTIYTYQS